MTEYRNGNMPRDGESDMPQDAHEHAMWDAAYVLGALSDPDRREFEEHMAGCISCREAVNELTAVSPSNRHSWTAFRSTSATRCR